ncbi:MAG: bifunctional precorrin-2 dehydrogenase/sirohydrochlorin ferrochelatase [Fibrobacter sp.]|nr:bifunctional precorrin-2 dehydrogenase/sirohydrochlorin ferrochelatase [Fibrobacter sp.]
MNDKSSYPVMLRLENVNCLLVGGGKVAQRKLEKLLETGARVTIVSPEITETVRGIVSGGKAKWIADTYKSCYLAEAGLVVCATNDTLVNEKVFSDAAERKLFVNVVDDPQHCTFLIPAVLNKGNIQVAVCSGGAAPVVSVNVRNKIDNMITDELVQAVDILKQNRNRIKKLPSDKKKLFWEKVEACLDKDHDYLISINQLFSTFLDI